MKPDPRDKWPMWLLIVLQLLIVYSLVTIALETMPELAAWKSWFWYSELVVVTLFTIEYAVVWAQSEDRARYPFRPMAIIDLLAILPFYVSLGPNLLWLRSLRFLRIFRILKLGRYNAAVRFLGQAFINAFPQLVVFGMLVMLAVISSGMLLYYAEHDAQPENFRSIPESLWWAIVTLTTVGYGDVSPVTPLGRVIASGIMLLGIGLVAVPTGIFSSTMSQMVNEILDSPDDKTGSRGTSRLTQLFTKIEAPLEEVEPSLSEEPKSSREPPAE